MAIARRGPIGKLRMRVAVGVLKRGKRASNKLYEQGREESRRALKERTAAQDFSALLTESRELVRKYPKVYTADSMRTLPAGLSVKHGHEADKASAKVQLLRQEANRVREKHIKIARRIAGKK